MCIRDSSLALPIVASLRLLIALDEINQVIGATITKVAIIAITIGINAGAPPYLVFIVQKIQQSNIILNCRLCQEKAP